MNLGKNPLIGKLVDREFPFVEDLNSALISIAKRFKLFREEICFETIGPPIAVLDNKVYQIGIVRSVLNSLIYMPSSYLEVVLTSDMKNPGRFKDGICFANSKNAFCLDYFDGSNSSK